MYSHRQKVLHVKTFVVALIVLNQAYAGQRSARNWFFEIAFVCDVCMHACVCVSTPEAINN